MSQVVWRPRSALRANSFNPNHVAPPEMNLLYLSILEDGWTQPIVITPTDDPEVFEVVDGYHRWTVAGDPRISAMTDGMVPTVLLPVGASDHRVATVRHNRARGVHAVVKMADIVADLIAAGMDDAEIGGRVGMHREEVRRLRERGDMLRRGAESDFGKGWVPK